MFRTIAEINNKISQGKVVVATATASLSSYARALDIATTLKEWIRNRNFLLSKPVEPLPGAGSAYNLKPLKERPI